MSREQLLPVPKPSKLEVQMSSLISNVPKICYLTRSIAGLASVRRLRRRDGTLLDADLDSLIAFELGYRHILYL